MAAGQAGWLRTLMARPAATDRAGSADLRAELLAAGAERDEARRELAALREQVGRRRAALLPFAGCTDETDPWKLPPGPHVAAAPQRYADNYARYAAAGGTMRAEDIAGFLAENEHSIFDRARFYFFALVADLVGKEAIPGDMAELGVAKGNTASLLALAAGRLGRELYLLDTFEGFAERDLDGEDPRHAGAYADTSVERVRSRAPGPHVHIVKGHFPDIASALPDDATYCVVHLDCDLYRPMASALAYFWPRLAPGGFLIVHDYTTLYWDGVERAVDEFFADRPEAVVPIPDMAGTVAVRKPKRPPGLDEVLGYATAG